MSKNFELSSALNSSRGLGDGRRRMNLPQHPPPRALVAQSAGQGGYTLGSSGNSMDQAQARAQQAKVNETLVASQKEKEREKKLKLLDEKIKRYSHLNISLGNKLGGANHLDKACESQIDKQAGAVLVHKNDLETKRKQPSKAEELLPSPSRDNNDGAMRAVRLKQQQQYFSTEKAKMNNM